MILGVSILIILTGTFLAFSNGANDNFKGVATLLGSKTTSYKVALIWATLTTFAGSVAAFFLAQKLMVNFSGKGLVPDSVVQMSAFSVSVALAAALTVFLATKLGFPISTTHAITGALVGAGILASPEGVNASKLFSSFFLPLLISPLIAIISAMVIYPLFRFTRKKLKVDRKSCLCIGNEVVAPAPHGFVNGAAAATLNFETYPTISFGTKVSCEERYVGEVWGLNAKTLLDSFHFLSSGLVSFARGLNDTPKIAALLLIGNSISADSISPMQAIGITGIAIAIGGVLMAKKIANTMSYEITKMNDGQGFSANLITSAIVIGASQIGMPVSTTHVSCGALFGIGSITKQAQWGGILKIVASWLITLPVAGVLGYLSFLIFRGGLS